jgi:hypothetical protein
MYLLQLSTFPNWFAYFRSRTRLPQESFAKIAGWGAHPCGSFGPVFIRIAWEAGQIPAMLGLGRWIAIAVRNGRLGREVPLVARPQNLDGRKLKPFWGGWRRRHDRVRLH